MSRAYTLPVDYDKLTRAIVSRNLDCSKASRQMGFASGYLQNVKRYQHLRKTSVLMLESMFGISYDEIKPDEPAATVEAEPERPQDDMADMLKAIMAAIQTYLEKRG